MSDLHAQFDPLRPPSTRGRAILMLAGPLLWLATLVIVAVVVHRTDLVRWGFFFAGCGFLLGLITLIPQHVYRQREERRSGPRR
jgi:bacteriorhodopsin